MAKTFPSLIYKKKKKKQAKTLAYTFKKINTF